MNGGEITRREDTQLAAISPEQAVAMVRRMEQLMQGMAGTISAMHEEMAQMKKQIQMLTPVTVSQEKALNAQIRQRSEELRKIYRLEANARTPIANAIRKEIKLVGGVSAIRELPRVEYNVYLERIALWDDYRAMKEIRTRLK